MPVYPSADKLPLCVQYRNEGIGSAVIIHLITRRVHRPELVTPWAVPEGIGSAVATADRGMLLCWQHLRGEAALEGGACGKEL